MKKRKTCKEKCKAKHNGKRKVPQTKGKRSGDNARNVLAKAKAAALKAKAADKARVMAEAKDAVKTKAAETKLAAQHKAWKTLASKVQVAVKGPLQALSKAMGSSQFANLGPDISGPVLAAFDKLAKIETEAKDCMANTEALTFDMKEVKAYKVLSLSPP